MWHMQCALHHANSAAAEGEVPIGAVLVASDGSVLARTHNLVSQNSDPTAHAELVAVREAAKSNGDFRLVGCTLYSTLEPCAMCLAALQLARVGRVVYAAPDHRLGAVKSFMSLLDHRHPYHPDMEVQGGLYEERSAELLRSFFRERRDENRRARRRAALQGGEGGGLDGGDGGSFDGGVGSAPEEDEGLAVSRDGGKLGGGPSGGRLGRGSPRGGGQAPLSPLLQYVDGSGKPLRRRPLTMAPEPKPKKAVTAAELMVAAADAATAAAATTAEMPVVIPEVPSPTAVHADVDAAAPSPSSEPAHTDHGRPASSLSSSSPPPPRSPPPAQIAALVGRGSGAAAAGLPRLLSRTAAAAAVRRLAGGLERLQQCLVPILWGRRLLGILALRRALPRSKLRPLGPRLSMATAAEAAEAAAKPAAPSLSAEKVAAAAAAAAVAASPPPMRPAVSSATASSAFGSTPASEPEEMGPPSKPSALPPPSSAPGGAAWGHSTANQKRWEGRPGGGRRGPWALHAVALHDCPAMIPPATMPAPHATGNAANAAKASMRLSKPASPPSSSSSPPAPGATAFGHSPVNQNKWQGRPGGGRKGPAALHAALSKCPVMVPPATIPATSAPGHAVKAAKASIRLSKPASIPSSSSSFSAPGATALGHSPVDQNKWQGRPGGGREGPAALHAALSNCPVMVPPATIPMPPAPDHAVNAVKAPMCLSKPASPPPSSSSPPAPGATALGNSPVNKIKWEGRPGGGREGPAALHAALSATIPAPATAIPAPPAAIPTPPASAPQAAPLAAPFTAPLAPPLAARVSALVHRLCLLPDLFARATGQGVFVPLLAAGVGGRQLCRSAAAAAGGALSYASRGVAKAASRAVFRRRTRRRRPSRTTLHGMALAVVLAVAMPWALPLRAGLNGGRLIGSGRSRADLPACFLRN